MKSTERLLARLLLTSAAIPLTILAMGTAGARDRLPSASLELAQAAPAEGRPSFGGSGGGMGGGAGAAPGGGDAQERTQPRSSQQPQPRSSQQPPAPARPQAQEQEQQPQPRSSQQPQAPARPAQAQERAPERSQERALERAQERTQERQERAQERAQERRQERAQDKPQERPEPRPQSRPERAQERAQDRQQRPDAAQERTRDRQEERAQERRDTRQERARDRDDDPASRQGAQTPPPPTQQPPSRAAPGATPTPTQRPAAEDGRRPSYAPGQIPAQVPAETAPRQDRQQDASPTRPDRDRDGRPDRDRDGRPDRADSRSPADLERDRRDTEFFNRRDARVDDLRGLRRERREEGGRVIIEEPGNRTIVRQGDRLIIRHDDTDRFRRVYGRDEYRVDRRGDQRFEIVQRPGGVEIVTVRDDDGRMLRRFRRERGGREVVLIDNTRRPLRQGYFVDEIVDLPPVRVGIPREKYIVEVDDASDEEIYEAFSSPPVERVQRAYSLDEVRQSSQLRERVRRVDLDTVTFASGSWELPQEQIARLEAVASAIKKAIAADPTEIFLIEGHTDAVGPDVDNLSLSDRRAETVATILSEEFQVPAENLTTQGYGEQYLKVSTQEASQVNRRVTIRRITPLLRGAERQP